VGLSFGVPGSVRGWGAVGSGIPAFAEADPLVLHHEAEHVATHIADPALPGLALRVNLQAGVLVFVPRAERNVTASLTAQLQMPTDQLDDIRRLADPFLDVLVLMSCEGHRRVLWR
jgi:hypothetical protein